MKLSKLMRFAAVFTLVAIVATFAFAGCGKTDSERFYAAYDVDASLHHPELIAKLKEKAIAALGVTPADAFVEAGYLDNVPIITLHVLTEELEYTKYSVKTDMNGPVVDLLSGGTSPYNDIASNYILNAVAELQDGVITFSEG